MHITCEFQARLAAAIVLAADIGGTHSRFAVFESDEDGTLCLRQRQWCLTGAVDSFARLVDQLTSGDMAIWLSRCTSVVVAVPGPVQNGKAKNLPNVPWALERSQLQPCFPQVADDNVHLINDFVAHALDCLAPNMADLICIQPGEKDCTGVLAAIGAGTGIGFCSLVVDANQNCVILPSEAGHQKFPFRGNDERRYEDFLVKEIGQATIDANIVVSGHGLALLHSFITGEHLSPRGAGERLTAESAVCRKFANFYGRVAQSYALSVLPKMGLYITGGVATKNRFLVDHSAFRTEFAASHTHRELLKRIPIYLNANEESGLWGAARYAVMMSKNRIKLAAS